MIHIGFKKFKTYMYHKWSPTSKLFFYLALIGIFISICLLFKPNSKNITYNTFIQNEISRAVQDNIVSDEKIKEIFLKFQLSLSEKRNSIPKEDLKTLPYYLQRPYNMIITISTAHGLGFEFVNPTVNSQINITKTDMPIENYYFSKYTTEENISKAKIFRSQYKFSSIVNYPLVGSREMVAIEKKVILCFKTYLLNIQWKILFKKHLFCVFLAIIKRIFGKM